MGGERGVSGMLAYACYAFYGPLCYSLMLKDIGHYVQNTITLKKSPVMLNILYKKLTYSKCFIC